MTSKEFKNFWFWLLIGLLIGWALSFGAIVSRSAEVVPFCKEWNTMGDMDGGEPLTSPQRQMFHLGYFLTKSDFVREMLVTNYPNKQQFVDTVVTCYEEHTPILVDEVNAICQCSNEDRKIQVDAAFSNYINDCIRETRFTK